MISTLRSSDGFTLLEIVVVMILIGIISSLTVFSIGEPAREQVEVEAERVQALLRLASDEAMLTSREYGVVFYRDGYGFVIHDPRNDMAWTLLDEGTFRSRQLPSGVSVDLVVDGLSVTRDDELQDNTPQLVLLSSGGRTPFRLRFTYQSMPFFELSGEYYGELELSPLAQ